MSCAAVKVRGDAFAKLIDSLIAVRFYFKSWNALQIQQQIPGPQLLGSGNLLKLVGGA